MKNFILGVLSIVVIGLGIYLLIDKDIIKIGNEPIQDNNKDNKVEETRIVTKNEDFEALTEEEMEDENFYYDKDFDYSRKIIDNSKFVLNNKEHTLTVTYRWTKGGFMESGYYELICDIEIDGKTIVSKTDCYDYDYGFGYLDDEFTTMVNFDSYRMIDFKTFDIFVSKDKKEYLILEKCNDFVKSVLVINEDAEVLAKIDSGNLSFSGLRVVEHDRYAEYYRNYDSINFYSFNDSDHSGNGIGKYYEFTIENDKPKYKLLEDNLKFEGEGGVIEYLNVMQNGELKWKK